MAQEGWTRGACGVCVCDGCDASVGCTKKREAGQEKNNTQAVCLTSRVGDEGSRQEGDENTFLRPLGGSAVVGRRGCLFLKTGAVRAVLF
jgi:hypothetical protein